MARQDRGQKVLSIHERVELHRLFGMLQHERPEIGNGLSADLMNHCGCLPCQTARHQSEQNLAIQPISRPPHCLHFIAQ